MSKLSRDKIENEMQDLFNAIDVNNRDRSRHCLAVLDQSLKTLLNNIQQVDVYIEIIKDQHLVKAAPSMLEALEYLWNETRLETNPEWNDKILNAIKKAKGLK